MDTIMATTVYPDLKMNIGNILRHFLYQKSLTEFEHHVMYKNKYILKHVPLGQWALND